MKTSISVQNMMCDGCCNTIRTELSKMNAISQVEIDLATANVSFHYNDGTALVNVKEKLETLGYPITEDPNLTSPKSKSFLGRITDKFSK